MIPLCEICNGELYREEDCYLCGYCGHVMDEEDVE